MRFHQNIPLWPLTTDVLASIVETFEGRSGPGGSGLFLVFIDSPERFSVFEADAVRLSAQPELLAVAAA